MPPVTVDLGLVTNAASRSQTDQKDPDTCVETSLYLDIYQPANITADDAAWGTLPVVLSVHGGGFTSGDKTMDPPTDYWAERGFVGMSGEVGGGGRGE